MRDPVVGRDPELERLSRFLTRIPTGVHALVLVGEAGIGKTALLREAVRTSRAAGGTVLAARPGEDERHMGLATVTDLLEPLDPRVELGTEDDPSRQGRAVLAALRAAAARGPVLVAIDDLQWIDPLSARVLRFALRRLDEEPVGILATQRVESDCEDPLDVHALVPPERCDRLGVGPLSLGALRRLLSTHVASISRPALRRIHEISGGNPMYAIELVRGLGDDERAYRTDTGLPLPGTLRAAVGARLDAVPEHVRPVLDAVAVHPRASVGELRAVLGDAPLEEALDDGIRLGLLGVDDRLRVRFTHPMLASVALERVGPVNRQALHAHLATAASDPDERARHVAHCTDGPNEAAAALLEEAAARARDRGALDAAADLAAHAVRLTPSRRDEHGHRRTLTHVSMMAAAGEVGQALQVADAHIAALPPGPSRAEALVRRAELEDDDLRTGESLLVRALEDLPDATPLRASVLDQLGWLRGIFRGDLPAGLRDAHEALEIAAAAGDDELHMSVAAGLSNMSAHAGVPRRDLIELAVELEARLGRPSLWAGPRVLLAEQMLWSGELDQARRIMEEAHHAALRSGNGRWLSYGLYTLSSACCAAGEFPTADEMVREAVTAARDSEDEHVEVWTLHRRALVAAWLGREADARDAAARRIAYAERRGESPGVARARGILGVLELSAGRPETALAELDQALHLLDEIGFANPGAIPVLPDAIDAHAAAGDADGAATLADQLHAQAQGLGNLLVDALADRCTGSVLLARGEGDAAAEVLDGAATTLDRLGYRADAARARLTTGQALLRAGRRTRAADALADAHRRFTAMGARMWAERAADDLERAAPGRSRGTLTPAERRVAALVAEGRRNREIAQAMHLSVATVEAHLTRIYRKLAIRSRNELTQRVVAGDVPDATTPPHM
ncbi:MAG: AAA family ATPase [Actinobacteria bacterium]|nr:AAA family ATPase [Thermoleophilia bacterium]MCB9010794.1 AAA family ATPase [Actinomycetota bacterium]